MCNLIVVKFFVHYLFLRFYVSPFGNFLQKNANEHSPVSSLPRNLITNAQIYSQSFIHFWSMLRLTSSKKCQQKTLPQRRTNSSIRNPYKQTNTLFFLAEQYTKGIDPKTASRKKCLLENCCTKKEIKKEEKKSIGETKVSPSQARYVEISRKMLTGAAESIL